MSSITEDQIRSEAPTQSRTKFNSQQLDQAAMLRFLGVLLGSLIPILFAFLGPSSIKSKMRVDVSAFSSSDTPTFVDLCGPELPPWLSSSCEKLGFMAPTVAQAMALPTILEGNDVILQSQWGVARHWLSLPRLSSVDPSRSASDRQSFSKS